MYIKKSAFTIEIDIFEFIINIYVLTMQIF